MKDFLGNELAVGDYVVLSQSNYVGLQFGKVLKFTPKNVTVARRKYKGSDPTHYNTPSSTMVKIDPDVALMFILANTIDI